MATLGRRFRFGVLYTGTTLEDWQEVARKAEELGFTTLVAQDHFADQLAPLPSLVAAAAVTTRLRFGTIVLDNDFRHPAALAKEAATVDVLTGGRFELGVGAGWLMADYEQTGLVFGSPRERMAKLAETVAILKAFFRDESVTFEGDHYHITGLPGLPRPAQPSGPPLMIGGRQKRMLSFAAREADIVSISMLDRRAEGEPPPPGFAEKSAWVREAAGPRFDDVVLHVNTSNIDVTEDGADAWERASQRLGRSVEDLRQSPANLIGSVEEIAELLMSWRERCGVSYFVAPRRFMEPLAPVVARLAGT